MSAAHNMTDGPYRELAEIAEEIPPMPKEREPWPTARKVFAWISFCTLGVDASVAIGKWGDITRVDVGATMAIHFIIAGLVGLVCLVERVKL